MKQRLAFIFLLAFTAAILTLCAHWARGADINLSDLKPATGVKPTDALLINWGTPTNTWLARRAAWSLMRFDGVTNSGFRSSAEFGITGGATNDESLKLQAAFTSFAATNRRPATLIVQALNSNDPIRLDRVVSLQASDVRVEFRSPLLLSSNAGVRIMGKAAEMTRNGKAKAQLASNVSAGAMLLPLAGGTNQLHASDLVAGDVLVIRGQNDVTGYALQHEIVTVESVDVGADTVTLNEALEYSYQTTYPASDWPPDLTTGTTIGLLAFAPLTNSVSAGAYAVQCNPTNLAEAGITNGTVVRLYTGETEYDIVNTATNSSGEPYANSARLELRNVVSVSAAGLVTLDSPIVDTYATNVFAGLLRFSPVTNSHLVGARITWRENQLTKNVHGLQIGYGYNCSVQDCSVDGRAGQRGQGIRVSDSLECAVLRSRVSYPKYLGSGEGYGITVYYSERCQVLGSQAEGCRHNILVQKANGTEIAHCRSVNDGISGIDTHGVRSFNTIIRDCQLVGGPLWAATHKSALRVGNTAHVCGDFGTLIENCHISGLVVSNANQTYAALDIFPASHGITWRGGQVADADVGLRLSDDGQDDNLIRSNLVVEGVTFARVRQLAQVDSATTNRAVLVANTTSVDNTNAWTFAKITGLQVLYNRQMNSSTNITTTDCPGAVVVHPGAGTGGGGGAGMTNQLATNVLYVATWGNNATAQRGRPDLPWASVSNAVAAAGNNERVVITAGNYTNTHPGDFYSTGEAHVPIFNKTNFVIEGVGWPRIYAPTCAHLVVVYKCSNVVVRGLHLDSELFTNLTYQPLAGGVFGHLTYSDSEWLTIEDNLLTRGTDHAILEVGNGSYVSHPSTNQITIRHNRIKSFGHWGAAYGAAWWDGAGVVCGTAHVHGNHIEDTARGIELYPKENATTRFAVVENNVIKNTMDYGIGGAQWVKASVLRGNTIYNEPTWTLHVTASNAWAGSSGIELAGQSDSVIAQNVIEGKKFGIKGLAHNGGALHRNTIEGNTIYGCADKGISIQAVGVGWSTNNVVRGNTIINVGNEGLSFYHELGLIAENNLIVNAGTNNAANGNGLLFDLCTNVTVRFNTLSDTGPGVFDAGIQLVGVNGPSTNGAVVLANRFVGGISPEIVGALPYTDYLTSVELQWTTNGLDGVQTPARNLNLGQMLESGTITLSSEDGETLSVWDEGGPTFGSVLKPLRAGGLRLPDNNAGAGRVWTCTNATTGAGEWRARLDDVLADITPAAGVVTNVITFPGYKLLAAGTNQVSCLATSNRLGGRVQSAVVFLENFTGSNVSVYLGTNSWRWLGSVPAYPVTLTNTKTLILSLTTRGTAETNVYATFSYTP